MPWKTINIGSPRKHGQCSLAVQKDRLIVVFPRKCFAGKQRSLSLGLVDTPNNRAIAVSKIQTIQNDIDLGQFDPTLERYKPQTKQQGYLKTVTNLYPDIDLLSLWLHHFEYKKPSLKESTIDYLETSVSAYLVKAQIKSPYQALELRQWLLLNTTESMAKRVLIYVHAAFEWGIKHKLIIGNNPYKGMANELKHPYEIETNPNAFTTEEKEEIINAFHRHPKKSCAHYANFVQFLFLTGCRPHEAIGLRWQDISKDFKKITFDGGISQLSTGKLIRTKGSKNNRKRIFPCNPELEAFLRRVWNSQCCLTHPLTPSNNALAFVSSTNQPIRYDNFSRYVWSAIVIPIKANTTPYCCRDTFITEQIVKGVNPAIVGKWVDNSTTTIERHYFDENSSNILPR